MKKLLVTTMVVVQLAYCISISRSFSSSCEGNVPSQLPVFETCGISSLFTIVCSNTISMFRQIAELGDLISTLPDQNDRPAAPQDDPQNRSVVLAQTSRTFAEFKYNSLALSRMAADTAAQMNTQGSITCSHMIFLFLWGIFLYLFKLKYFRINARRSIGDSILISALLTGTINPRFAWISQTRVFLLLNKCLPFNVLPFDRPFCKWPFYVSSPLLQETFPFLLHLQKGIKRIPAYGICAAGGPA